MVRVPYTAALVIWEGIESNWIGLITSLTNQGISWRGLSAVELIWLVHTNTIERLKEERPQQVRIYLNATKDYTSLREWDKSQMKES